MLLELSDLREKLNQGDIIRAASARKLIESLYPRFFNHPSFGFLRTMSDYFPSVTEARGYSLDGMKDALEKSLKVAEELFDCDFNDVRNALLRETKKSKMERLVSEAVKNVALQKLVDDYSNSEEN